MKKLYGWILIISCSFLLLSFTTSFFVIIPGIFSKNPSFYLSGNEIFSLIENSLSIKISSEDSLDKDININGKEELVEKIKTLIDDVRIKERTLTLETVKANVYRNFDMKWLNEQITNLTKIKIGSNFILKENIQDPNTDTQFKAEIIDYFVKKLNESRNIEDFEFDYDPAEGIFKFYNETEGIVVKATPFYNDNDGFPIEVFDEDQMDNHIFIEQKGFDMKELLFQKYMEIMKKFLIDDFDKWMNKVDKFDKGQDLPKTDVDNMERPEPDRFWSDGE